MLLHLEPNVITFRTLLHLGPNVITFRTLLHLGQLLHLGLQHLFSPIYIVASHATIDININKYLPCIKFLFMLN